MNNNIVNKVENNNAAVAVHISDYEVISDRMHISAYLCMQRDLYAFLDPQRLPRSAPTTWLVSRLLDKVRPIHTLQTSQSQVQPQAHG